MKAILQFTLPEEKYDFDLATKAGDFHSVLWDMWQHLRSKLKYEELTDEQRKIYEEVREKFNSLLQENNVEL